MPIRTFDDPSSGTPRLEAEWFKKQEMSETEPNRFVHMPKGTRKGVWEHRVDLENIYLDDTDWLIDHEKFVNRPDAIAYKFYGNSKYWWIIAERNGITDPFKGFYKGRKLKIPDLVTVRKVLGI